MIASKRRDGGVRVSEGGTKWRPWSRLQVNERNSRRHQIGLSLSYGFSYGSYLCCADLNGSVFWFFHLQRRNFTSGVHHLMLLW